MRTALWLTTLAMAIFLTVGPLGRALAQEDTRSLQGKPAPNFSLKTVDGKDVQLASQKGKVVVVDFWATWCPPCRKSLPHVQELSANKDLAGKGLVVWAVNNAEAKGKVEPFLKEHHFTFTVPMDAQAAAARQYLVRGIPTTVVVGRDGLVKSVFIGYSDEMAKALDQVVEKALAEKAK